MIEIENRKILFKTKQIWFSDKIFDVKGYSGIVFSGCGFNEDIPGFNRRLNVTSVIDLTTGLDAIWKGMDRSRCRNSIKRAEKNGVAVKMNENHEEFYRLYQNLKAHRKEIGRLFSLDMIKKSGLLFTAEHDGEVIGGHFYLSDNDNMLCLIAATDHFNVDNKKKSIVGSASHLLHWEAIKYGIAEKKKNFDLGGLFAGEGTNYYGKSIDSFKESFGGKRTVQYSYSRYYSHAYLTSLKIASLFLGKSAV